MNVLMNSYLNKGCQWVWGCVLLVALSACAGDDGGSAQLDGVGAVDPNAGSIGAAYATDQQEADAGRTTQTISDDGMSTREEGSGHSSFVPPSQQKKEAAGPKYPYGRKVAGKDGMVKSPFAPYANPVDVKGIPSGTAVKCPYTGKVFLVP